MSEPIRPPKSSKVDIAISIAKAVAGEFPGGSTLAELVGQVLGSPLERRKREWMESIGKAIHDLQSNQGITIESLQANDVFIDTLLQASREAVMTSEREKLDALRNAVINAVANDAPEASVQQCFLAMVERLTPWHLRILKLFDAPEAWFAAHGQQPPGYNIGSLVQTLTAAYPQLANRRDMYDQFWRDLYLYGLVNTDSLHAMMSAQGARESRTSQLGKQFLKFITSPTGSPGRN